MTPDRMCVQTLLKGRYVRHTELPLRSLRSAAKERQVGLQPSNRTALLLRRPLPEATRSGSQGQER